jgi:hypothetical protein
MRILEALNYKKSFICACSFFVFFRLVFLSSPFSLDYDTYIAIISLINNMSFFDMIGNNFTFPYVDIGGVLSIEFGFSLLVKLISLFIYDPKIIFAFIASLSVGLRIYSMEMLRVPRYWTLALNIYAITILEANAIRLGVAVSILIFSIYQFRIKNNIFGTIAILISLSFHIQIIIFAFPFVIFHFVKWTNFSRFYFYLYISVTTIFTYVISQMAFIFSGNDKVQEYINRGESGGAGISVTSTLAVIFMIISILSIKKNMLSDYSVRLWSSILAASIPSVFLFVFLTNVAVIGDRSWQVVFIVLSSTFFFVRDVVDRNKISFAVILTILITVIVNVTIRYPLSNFFAPPFPEIIPVERF